MQFIILKPRYYASAYLMMAAGMNLYQLYKRIPFWREVTIEQGIYDVSKTLIWPITWPLEVIKNKKID